MRLQAFLETPHKNKASFSKDPLLPIVIRDLSFPGDPRVTKIGSHPSRSSRSGTRGPVPGAGLHKFAHADAPIASR